MTFSPSDRDVVSYKTFIKLYMQSDYLFLRYLMHKPCCTGEEWNVKEEKCVGKYRLHLHLMVA